MFSTIRHCLLTGAGLLLLTGAARAQDTFADGNFTNWLVTNTQSSTTGYATDTVFATGGDPGAYIQVNNHTGNSNYFYGIILDENAVYNPADGPISSISGSYDTISNISDNGQGTGLALQQGGVEYISTPETGYFTSWHAVNWSDLSASAFTDFPGTSHPNFSLTGAPITFGIVNWNVGTNRTTLSDFDNFSVTLNGVESPDVPEPGVIAIIASLAVSGSPYAVRRRRPHHPANRETLADKAPTQ